MRTNGTDTNGTNTMDGATNDDIGVDKGAHDVFVASSPVGCSVSSQGNGPVTLWLALALTLCARRRAVSRPARA